MIVGIDPSLTNTAIFVGDENGYESRCFKSTNCGDDVRGRVRRLEGLVHEINGWLTEQGDKIQSTFEGIFIEGYSYGSNDARAKFGAEYGGVLRWHLVDHCPRIYEVAPSTLKKFATGNGRGKKEQVIAHVTKRYGTIFDTNDEYDAFVLLQLGLVAMEQINPQTIAQREAAMAAIGEKVKRKRKKKPDQPTLPLEGATSAPTAAAKHPF